MLSYVPCYGWTQTSIVIGQSSIRKVRIALLLATEIFILTVLRHGYNLNVANIKNASQYKLDIRRQLHKAAAAHGHDMTRISQINVSTLFPANTEAKPSPNIW